MFWVGLMTEEMERAEQIKHIEIINRLDRVGENFMTKVSPNFWFKQLGRLQCRLYELVG